VTEPASPAPTAEELAPQAARAVYQRDWLALTALLAGPLSAELMQPVLRVLRKQDDDPQTLSDLARTLVRRLDVGAEAAVVDLRLWTEAPGPLREARLEAWRKLAAGRRGDRRAALAAPALWMALLSMDGFHKLPDQARAVALIEAAHAHWRSGRRDGSIPGLQRAVALAEEAASIAADLPHAAEALTVAGDAGLDLWRFAPRMGDLGQALKHARNAYAVTPDGHPRQGWRAARLAGKLVNRSIHDGTVAPLEEALALLRGAPDATADPEDRSGVLHDLARAAGRRWQITRERDDLDLCVIAARRAVDEVPPESLDVRIMKSGLAVALHQRGVETGSLDDLEQALHIRRELVSIETDGPREGLVRSNLARSLRALGERTGRRALLDEAVDTLLTILTDTDRDSAQYATRLHDLARCYRARARDGDRRRARHMLDQALAASESRPEVRAVVANDLGSLLEHEGERANAALAYDAALDALRELQQREDHLADRFVQLGRVENLPANATRAALRAWGPRSALRVADKGRTVVLSEILGLAPADGEEVPRDVLCLGAADVGGFAILITEHGSAVEECPQLTSAAATERVRAFAAQLERRHDETARTNRAIEDLSTWLGEVLLLDRLRLPEQVSIVALGPLALLPTHLAAYEGRPMCLQREVTIRLRPSRLRAPQRAVPVSEGIAVSPSSDRLAPLLLVDQEARALSQAVTRCVMLCDSDASRDGALQALRRADVVHFAGHARSLPDRPLDSGILLSGDEQLTVADLLFTLPSGHLKLMALTGCETAVMGRRVPDESVSLAAGAVVAGAESAVSTLWPVSQVAAALICTRFYAHWQKDPDHPAAALAAAQRWMYETPAAKIAEVCQEFGAPVTDPAQLSQPLHWAGWTVAAP
jgi:tetratricopeptide (TPR) repeat protein